MQPFFSFFVRVSLLYKFFKKGKKGTKFVKEGTKGYRAQKVKKGHHKKKKILCLKGHETAALMWGNFCHNHFDL